MPSTRTMARLGLALSCLLALAACASSGGAPPRPTTWTPGAYFVEATVSYRAGIGTERRTYSADVYVETDGRTLRLDSHHGGLCQTSTAEERQRDDSGGVRTFRCGELTYRIHPSGDSLSGTVSAVVPETYSVTICVEYGVDGACKRTRTEVRTRDVTRQASLRVRPRV